MPPVHAAVPCRSSAFVAVGVCILGLLAAAGAMVSPPSRVAETASVRLALAPLPVIQLVAHPQAVNVSSVNLKLPRATRHRSERPTSGGIDAEALAATAVIAILDEGERCPFVLDPLSARPLAGHPLSLLRPPSLLAG